MWCFHAYVIIFHSWLYLRQHFLGIKETQRISHTFQFNPIIHDEFHKTGQLTMVVIGTNGLYNLSRITDINVQSYGPVGIADKATR